jgi:2-phospho-L-lactate guanylyltransferase
LAFACDVVVAATRSDVVRRVLVVTNDPAGELLAGLGADLVRDVPDAGLNPALAHAAAVAREDDPLTLVAAMSSDLPAVRPEDIDGALDATAARRWFVRDSHGQGTTLLAALPGIDLEPAFGPGSAARHAASGAAEISRPDLERIRRDVDTEDDLAVAQALGVGTHTAEVLARIGRGG